MLLSNPLLNDDRNLNTQGGLELSSPPVGLGNPLVNDNGSSPLAGLQAPAGLQDMGQFQQGINSIYTRPAPVQAMPSQAQIFYSPSTGDIVVNGAEPFNEQNASAALASEEWANQPARRFTLPDTASDWREMPREEYAAYIDSIRNPGYGRRISEAWQHAWRGVGDVAVGASLAVNPEWEWAQTARDSLRQEFINDAPFLMRLQDIENPGDALTYVSQMAVQGVPWFVETLVSMGVGALIGGAVSGGVGAPAGAVEGFVANQAIRAATRRSIETALRQNLTRGARAYQQASAARVATQQGAALTREEVAEFAVRNNIASADDVNRFFNFGERAYHMARGAQPGAVSAMFGSNYMTGVGDIRNSIEDAGGDPQSADAVANIWGMALPYALIESLGDIIVTQPLTSIGPDIFNATARSARIGDQLLARGANATRGMGIVGASEGIEEGAQYLITQQGVAGATNRPIDIEPIDLLENVAGGFFAGAGLGGISYGLKRPEIRLEEGTQPETSSGSLTPEGGAGTLPFYGTQDTAVPGQDVPPPPAYMGGLEVPDIDPAYGTAGPLQIEPTGRPVSDTHVAEREALLNTLQDPNITPEQYAATVQAIDALSGGRGVDVEAANRYRAGANRGVLPDYGPMPEYQEPEILLSDEELKSIQQEPPRAQDRNDIDLPPGMTSLEQPARSRPIDELYKDLVTNQQLEFRELQTLREHIYELMRRNPTNPVYSDIINAINSVEYEMANPQKSFPKPELAPINPNQGIGTFQTGLPSERAKPVDNPIMEDGLPKYGPHRLKKPVKADGTHVEEQPDLIEQAKQLAKKEKAKGKRSEQRKKARALKRADKQAERDAKMREMAERTEEDKAAETDKRAMRPFGRKDQERQKEYEAFRRANEEATRESALPETKEEQLEKPEPAKQTTNRIKEAAARAKSAAESNDLKEAASIKPKTEDKQDTTRGDKAYKQGMRHYKDVFKFLQGARGKLGRSKKFSYEGKRDLPLPFTSTSKWLVVNDEALSFNELTALIERIRIEFTSSENTERSARVFHDYVNDAWQQNKADPKFFASFVKDNVEEIRNWLDSETSKLLPPARTAAQRTLASLNDNIVRAANVSSPRPLVMPDYGKHLKVYLRDSRELKQDKGKANSALYAASITVEQLSKGEISTNENGQYAIELAIKRLTNAIDIWKKHNLNASTLPELEDLRKELGRTLAEFSDSPVMAASVGRYATTVTNILRRVLTENPNFTFTSIHPATRERSKAVVEEIHAAQREAGIPESSVDALSQRLWQLKQRMRNNDKPIPASDEEITNRAGLVTKREVKSIVDGVQKRIAPAAKFKSIHVFKDVEDMLARANDEILIAPNGAEVNLGRLLMGMALQKKLENQDTNIDFTDLQWVRVVVNQDFNFRAGVLNRHDALIVFSDKLGDRRHALQTLEHEWIVHKGLRAIFPTEEARYAFLNRVSKIPGMDEKRKALLARKGAEIYASLHILDQYEEVLAFHAEGGLLALEALLSGPETMNTETRMSLWEEFKAIVKDFLARVFGDTRSITDQVLDEIIGMLQQYAITGTLPSGPATAEAANQGPSDTIIRAANLGAMTPQETYELLHGQGDNIGRPYSQTSWREDVLNEAKSSDSIMAKLNSIAKGKVATPIKERLKAIGRELVTMNQMSMESPLIEKMMEIMDNTIKRARFLMGTWTDARPHAHRDFLTTELTKRWGDKAPGATDKQRATYGRMAIAATNHLLSKLSDSMVRQAPRLLVRHPNGTYEINYSTFDKLLKQGTLSKEAFMNGLEQYTVDSEGDVTPAGTAKFTKEEVDSAYEIYLIETKLMAESALVTLEDATVMLSQKNNRAIARLIKDNKFKESDQPFVNEALQRMYKLYTDIAFHDYANKTINQKVAQADRARQVLAELMRTFHEEKKVADWTDSRVTRDDTAKSPRKNDAFKWREQIEPHEDVKPFVNQIRWFLEYDSTFGNSRLARINSLGVSDNRQYHMLNVFQNLLNAETMAHERENKVIQSILGNYVEMTRKGKWRVSFEVYEEDGKTPADISPVLLAKLPAIYAESEREANAIQAELSKEFGDQSYTVNDAEGNPVKVKFDIAVALAPGQATMTDAPDIEGFLKVGELVGLKINASMMKRITQMIANASTRKRFGLQRAGSPGMDADIIRNNSETMTQRAWEAAKTSQSHMLEDELTDPKNRYGDWDKLEELQRKFDIANRGAPEGIAPPITFVRNPKAVLVAELELLRYANQMKHVARRTINKPTIDIRTTKGELKLKITGEAEAYITHAKALRESLDKNQLELNLNDLISKTGSLRQLAVVSQLGTIASGIMNAFTPITHLPARLMAIHRETGYGDGFGMSEVVAEIASAMSQVMTVFEGYGDTVMLKEILDKARNGDSYTNLTLPELEAMYAETLNGVLTPQQTYSLTGGTESNLRTVLWRNLSNVLLKPFSSVEAGTRRVAFLSSYRLLKQRFIAAGVGTEEEFNTPGTDAYKKLIREVERVIKDSQGDYTNVNRPRAFRGDFAQYILQYKMFPLITVLMINNLPLAQKGVVLGTLFLLAGVKGEPFADDFMDIYDTVMQKLGLQHDSLELSMVQFFEDLLPGSSKWIMRGAIDNVSDSFGWSGGTMSSRLAMGDIIPLTGLFRPEADVGREVVNAFGPAFAANMDWIEYASILTDHALEFSGLRPRTSAWEDLIRKFPQGQVRGIGEAAIMGATGELSDPRGRLTSDEVTIYNIFMRALGFYPLEASKANDTVRLDRMHTGYMRNVRTRFVLAYARAYRAGDEAGMERISDAVRDWNEAAELTGQDDMLIRNFRSAAIRAGRAASQTAVERTASSAPDYSMIDELAAATGADTETDE